MFTDYKLIVKTLSHGFTLIKTDLLRLICHGCSLIKI